MDKDEFGQMLSKLLRDAREYDRSHENSHKVSETNGLLLSIVTELYSRLKDDDFLATFYPDYVKEKTDEISEELLMEKLSS